ncbi:hypothetical protein [Moritella yayanosii]|uniref:Uncharacterized protein n=1 Tax=Moritella yayanosii TaxID=69539 RepID=A0A330LJH1_9GAMM|nr:hypothetical protein [Moritella yayanosii]SQD77154.1 conserved membrane protein of unknown function [Moritella yayanosii]
MNKENETDQQEMNEIRWQEERKLRDTLDAELLKAPVSYEWRLMVKFPIAPKLCCYLMGVFIGGLFVYRGMNEGSLGSIIFGFIFGLILISISHYLFFPDKDTHYKLTPLGIIYTEKDTIPDVAYTIMRGFAWFSVVVCLATVVYVGPLAFVGAGGMALLAVKFTGFKAVTKALTVNFVQDYKVKIWSKAGIMSLCSQPIDFSYSCKIHYKPSQEAELLEALSRHINIEQVIKVKGHRALGYYD